MLASNYGLDLSVSPALFVSIQKYFPHAFLAVKFSCRRNCIVFLNNNKTALSPAFATKAQPLNMLPVEGVDLLVNNAAAASSNVLLATSSSDFGGAFYPVAGIALLATLILYLSPPLSDS
jgi:hypothetical protein